MDPEFLFQESIKSNSVIVYGLMWLLLCWKHASAGFGSFFLNHLGIFYWFMEKLVCHTKILKCPGEEIEKFQYSADVRIKCGKFHAGMRNVTKIGGSKWGPFSDMFFFSRRKTPNSNGSFLLFPSKYDYFWVVSPSVDALFFGVSHSLFEPWSRGVSMVSMSTHEAENPGLLGIGIRAKGIGSANFLGNSWRIVFRMENDSMS